MKKITPWILGFRSGSDPLKKTHNTTWVSTNHFPLSQGPFLWPDKLERALHCNDANILGADSSNPVILCVGIVGLFGDMLTHALYTV